MNTLSSSTRKKRRNAFTLIEIMVATVIMVVLVGLVIQITSEVLKVWTRSSGKLSANAEARVAMDMITQDLETAVFRNNGLRWLEAEQDTFEAPLSGTGFKTTKLKLFSPALDRPSDVAGDICGVSYLLDYRNAIDGTEVGDRTFILYRQLVDPKTTFDDLMGAGNQEVLSGGEWANSAIIGTDGANYLVSNIVDFRVDFHVVDDGYTSTSTLVAGDVFFGGTSSTVGSGAESPAEVQFANNLAYAVIILTVIPDDALNIIQNNVLSQTGFSGWKEFIAANSEVFTRRVNFMAHPL